MESGDYNGIYYLCVIDHNWRFLVVEMKTIHKGPPRWNKWGWIGVPNFEPHNPGRLIIYVPKRDEIPQSVMLKYRVIEQQNDDHTIFWSDQNRGLPNSSIEMEHTDKSLDFVGVLCTIFGQNYSAPFQGELEDATVDSFIAVPEVYLDLLKDQVHRLKNGVQTFLEV